jgi:hypothetical protein
MTVILDGHDERGEPTEILIHIADVPKIAPLLFHAASVAIHQQWPAEGTKINPGYVAVAQFATEQARDTGDVFLRIHTSAGTLHLLFASEDAAKCGKELQLRGTATVSAGGSGKPN